MIEWLGDPEDRKSLVKRYCEDRDLLLMRYDQLYPAQKDWTPSRKVEGILTDVCRFHVVDEPLPFCQLALCDFANRLVIVNSDMGSFAHREASVDLLRRSTLAHELGHIRLHLNEVTQCHTLDHQGGRHFRDSRWYQKEREADLYSGLFLVPLKSLLKEAPIQNLLRCKVERHPIPSSSLWKLIYRYASIFEVSPSLMKRCLVDLGWIESCGRGRHSELKKLRIRF